MGSPGRATSIEETLRPSHLFFFFPQGLSVSSAERDKVSLSGNTQWDLPAQGPVGSLCISLEPSPASLPFLGLLAAGLEVSCLEAAWTCLFQDLQTVLELQVVVSQLIWMLGPKPRFWTRTVCVLKCWVISAGPSIFIIALAAHSESLKLQQI